MKVDLGLAYAISAAVCCAIIVLIFIRIIKDSRREIFSDHLFELLLFFSLFCFTDCVWGLFASKCFMISQLGFTIASYAFHAGCAISAFMLFGYMISYVGIEGSDRTILRVIRLIIAISQIAMLVTNFWTKAAFYIDENGDYHTGTLRTIMFLAQFAYYLVFFITAIVYSLSTKRDDENKKKRRSAVYISVVPIVFGILQWMFPDLPMYSFGFALTAVVLNIYLVQAMIEKYMQDAAEAKDRKHMSIISSITRDYEAIYYVDRKTKHYDVFVTPGEDGVGTLEKLQYGEDFFKDCVKNIQTVIYEADRNYVTRKLSEENISYELYDKSSFSFDYRLLEEGEPKYVELTCVRPKDELEKDKLIIAVRDVDAATKKQMKKNERLKEALEMAQTLS